MNDEEVLKKRILEELEKEEIVSVSELAKKLKLEEEALAELLLELESEEKIELIETIPADISFFEYLRKIDNTAWFYLIVLGITLTVIFTLILPSSLITDTIRFIVGLFFIIFFPGYAILETLFPRRSDLQFMERLVLSVGLSIALVPAIGFILNYSFGIFPTTTVISLSIVTLALSFLALVRKYKIGKEALNGLKSKPAD